MLQVFKRDGTKQLFDVHKVRNHFVLSFDGSTMPNLTPLVNDSCERMRLLNQDTLTINQIQDCVEEAMMNSGHCDAARHSVAYRKERDEARARRMVPDPDMLATYIHISKYARYLFDLQRRENWHETVARVHAMHVRRWPQHKEMIDTAFDFVYQKKVLPSMRSMQFGGIAAEKDNARMYNCCYTLIDRIEVFREIFYLLLCGCGVGFSVQWKHIEKLPPLAYMDKKKVKHFVIPDTIRGWADAAHELVLSAINGYWVEFAYHEIRDEGTPLKVSGGKAPGHIPLRDCLEAMRTILLACQGRQLRPIEWHDIICYMAVSVVSGGIRRSSLISLFSPDDTQMLYAKASGEFRYATDTDPGLNPHRAMANNSAVLLRSTVDRTLFDRILRVSTEGYGEPGFMFTNNLDYGTNPCGEIGLYPVDDDGNTGFSFCNLCEVNAAAFENDNDFVQAAHAAAVIGTLQAHYTTFTYLGKTSENIAARDALLGVGICGMMDKPEIAFDKSLQRIAANEVMRTNAYVAKLIGINPAQRATTIKPGGTAPLALGVVGSGIHPHHARRYIRGVIANPNEPPAQYFKSINPHMVMELPNGNWFLRFPVQVGDDAITMKNMPALEFVGRVFDTYEYWIKPGTLDPDADLTHNISCTVSVRPEELENVQNAVWENRNQVQAMSFAPVNLDRESIIMPRKSIQTEQDELDWNNLIKLWKPVDWSQFHEEEDNTSLQSESACSGGRCEI